MIIMNHQPLKPSAPSQSDRKKATPTTINPEISPESPARITTSLVNLSMRKSASLRSGIACSGEVPTVERKRPIAQNCNVSLSPKRFTFSMRRNLDPFYDRVFLQQPFG